MLYTDRKDAGMALAELLGHLRGADPVVLGLPRGGVVVAYEVARYLPAPLDVIVTRKLGAPRQPEFGFGAVGPGGVRVIDEDSVAMLGLSRQDVERIVAQESAEMARREARYRQGRQRLDVRDRTVVLVDDGLATGVTARAAIAAIGLWAPKRLVLAVPVAPPDTARALAEEVDELVCPSTPVWFQAVGQWYRHFEQTCDEEVIDILTRAASRTVTDAGVGPGQ